MAARRRDRLRGARRRARDRGIRRLHRARHRSALHGDAVRAVHEPRRGAAHGRQRVDRAGSSSRPAGSRSSCCARLLALPGMALLLRVAPWIDRVRGGEPAMNPPEIQRDRASRPRLLQPDRRRPRSSACSTCCRSTTTSRVLDLGCGRAELALRIIERFGSTVVAIDHSSPMLDAARERAEWTGALGKLHLDDVDIARLRGRPRDLPPVGDAGRRRHRRRHGRHLQRSSRTWTKVGRLRPDRRGLLAAEAAPRVPGVPGRPTRSTSTIAATCRPASTPG